MSTVDQGKGREGLSGIPGDLVETPEVAARGGRQGRSGWKSQAVFHVGVLC